MSLLRRAAAGWKHIYGVRQMLPGGEAPPEKVQRGADLLENSLIFHNFLLAIYAMGVIMHL